MGAWSIGESFSPSLDLLVVALCADYERREALIYSRSLPSRVEAEYRYLNAKIRCAAEEILGEGIAPIMIKEVGERIGYAKTELGGMSEKSYKTKKHALKLKIAKRLHLL